MIDNYSKEVDKAKASALKQYETYQKKKSTGDKNLILFLLCGLIVLIGVFYVVEIRPWNLYSSSVKNIAKGNYSEAERLLSSLGSYRDSADLLEICAFGKEYNQAMELKNSGEYEAAIMKFKNVESFKDSTYQIAESKTVLLIESAEKLIDRELYDDSLMLLEQAGELNVPEYDNIIDQHLAALVKNAYSSGKYETAANALYMMKDDSLIDADIKEAISNMTD